ncbi:MAG: TIGR01777 family protein [Chlamydiales bacterium]|nr:TIGR01777 family protein [Chlamydiales bacterium]
MKRICEFKTKKAIILMKTFIYKTIVNASKEEVVQYFSTTASETRLIPPWYKRKRVVYKQSALVAHLLNSCFFHMNTHTQELHSIDTSTTEVIDCIKYSCSLLEKYFLRQLNRFFSYRKTILQNDLLHMKRFNKRPLTILMSGSSGFIGYYLKEFFHLCGYDTYELTRKKSDTPHFIHWDVDKQFIEEEKLKPFDVVIHLSGENIVGYWTKKKKTAIYNSRINSTRFLAESLKKNQITPLLCICASADGLYGFDNHFINAENGPTGSDFLANVCKDWEKSSLQFKTKRLVNSRFSMVLSPKGGALKRLISLFKCFLGAILGSGKQHVSWIYIDDLVYQIHHMIYNDSLTGGVNICTPSFVTNRQFSLSLAKALHRPLLFRIPAFVLTLLMGDMAKSLFLCDKKIIPEKLIKHGAIFSHPDLERCLFFALGKENIDDMQKKSDV